MNRENLRRVGGTAALLALAEDFYSRVLSDATMATLFEDPSEPHARRLGLFLVQQCGGERHYAGERGFGFAAARAAHDKGMSCPKRGEAFAGRPFTTHQRDTWRACMEAAYDNQIAVREAGGAAEDAAAWRDWKPHFFQWIDRTLHIIGPYVRERSLEEAKAARKAAGQGGATGGAGAGGEGAIAVPPQPTPEMEAFFEERTAAHIDCVARHMAVMVGFRGVTDEALRSRASTHDASKWAPPERTGYIWHSWWHKQRNAGDTDYKLPPGVKEVVDAAIAHHLATNPHHAEFHSRRPAPMSDLDVVEMAADLTAISRELGSDSCKAWASANLPRHGLSEAEVADALSVVAQMDERLAAAGLGEAASTWFGVEAVPPTGGDGAVDGAEAKEQHALGSA